MNRVRKVSKALSISSDSGCELITSSSQDSYECILQRLESEAGKQKLRNITLLEEHDLLKQEIENKVKDAKELQDSCARLSDRYDTMETKYDQICRKFVSDVHATNLKKELVELRLMRRVSSMKKSGYVERLRRYIEAELQESSPAGKPCKPELALFNAISELKYYQKLERNGYTDKVKIKNRINKMLTDNEILQSKLLHYDHTLSMYESLEDTKRTLVESFLQKTRLVERMCDCELPEEIYDENVELHPGKINAIALLYSRLRERVQKERSVVANLKKKKEQLGEEHSLLLKDLQGFQVEIDAAIKRTDTYNESIRKVQVKHLEENSKEEVLLAERDYNTREYQIAKMNLQATQDKLKGIHNALKESRSKEIVAKMAIEEFEKGINELQMLESRRKGRRM